MIHNSTIGVIIPAFNESKSIARVISDIPVFVDTIIVVNNASTDDTSEKAVAAGAEVLYEVRKGYGYACLTGIARLLELNIDIVVFLDGDYSDYPDDMNSLVQPIALGQVDFVIGSRTIGAHEPGALLPQAIFGNWLATTLIRIFWSYSFTDLGPFRAIRMESLAKLHMQDRTYGWTVEMQIKAAKQKLRYKEVPVRYRKRIGKSKVTGTLSGTIKASAKILYTIFKHAALP